MVESVQKRYMDFSSVKLKFKYIRRKICIYIGIGIGQNDFENIGISNIGQNPILCIPNNHFNKNLELKKGRK